MALSALGDVLEIKDPVSSVFQSETTIAFALDRTYLAPWKVMIASMIAAGTLIPCPIAIYSDDPEVFKDPIVSLIADKKVLIDGGLKETLYDLAKNSVRRDERKDWNRGTFLKWAIFEEQETEQVLFLDADMVVLKPLEDLIEAHGETPLLCCPQFQRKIFDADANALEDLMQVQLRDQHSWRVNSGMMVARKGLLNQDFFELLVADARKKVKLHEQSHISFFFRKHSALRMMPYKFNFQELLLNDLNADDEVKMLQRVSILHYAGSKKPWAKRPSVNERRGNLLWHAFNTYAQPILS